MADARKERALLGRYELLRLVEEGVGGCLYQGRQVDGDKPALVKVIAPTLTRSVALGKYLYDAWADQKALIEHPNVLHVWDVGKQGELQYVAVEDAGGEPLSRRMDQAPLEVDQAFDILHQIAEGLRAAHRRDVVQGHLKPSDIILTADEMDRRLVKVAFIDMGVSAQESLAPVFGELLGSPKYMAPEVIRGRMASPESDVFSLGVIAYEILTGKEPFPSDNSVGYLFANCESQPVPADEVRDGLPHEVAMVLARMLEKEPTQRYRSMQRLTDDLDRCLSSMKTGQVEVVPYGTDSAFARDYEMTPPSAPARKESASKGPQPVSSSARALFLLAMLVVVAGLYYIVTHSPTSANGASGAPAPSGVFTNRALAQAHTPTPGPAVKPAAEKQPSDTEQPPAAEQTTPPTPPATSVEQPPAPQPPAPEPAATPKAAADPAQEALAKAQASWAVHQQMHDYELGVTTFDDVATRFKDTPAATEARRQMGQIYTTWARSLADKDEFSDAVEKYHKALDLLPADSQFAQLANSALPGVMVSWAESEQNRGEYAHALQILTQVAKDYPGTVQARLLEQRRPELLLNNARTLWKDKKDYGAAAGAFAQVSKEYPNTKWAQDAQAALPDLYLESATQHVAQGDLTDARRTLQQLTEAYPGQEVAQKAQDLDAQVLFGLYQKASDAKDSAKADESYGELLQDHPSSPWAVKAIRLRLGLTRAAGEPTFSVTNARAQLADAKKAYDSFDYRQAIETLRSVLRYANGESQEAGQALALLPAWSYEDALGSFGRGVPAEAKKKLADLSSQFPNTEWSKRAAQTLKNVDDAPDGMVYVPEGRFQMGEDMDAIAKIIKAQKMTGMPDTPDAVQMAAELYGLTCETPEHAAITGGFYIDKTEVTNQQYKKFVDETGYVPPAQWRDGNYPDGQGAFPVGGVTLADARRYAQWRGCRLPTEAEWEKAARGVDGRRFPWGDTWADNRCRHMLAADAGPVAVGSFPTWPSPYGCLDMIGNVQEWTSSKFLPYPGSIMEQKPTGENYVTRGGAWTQPNIVPIPSDCTSRYPVDPKMSFLALGFRCVKDAPGFKPPAAAAAPSAKPATAATPNPAPAAPKPPAPASAASTPGTRAERAGVVCPRSRTGPGGRRQALRVAEPDGGPLYRRPPGRCSRRQSNRPPCSAIAPAA